jgi:uncharacterized protein (DUF58 family)
MSKQRSPVPDTILDLAEPGLLLSGWLTREGKVWLAVAGLLLLTGFYKGINLLVLLGYIFLVVWFFNYLLTRRELRSLKLARGEVPALFVGEPVFLALLLRHRTGHAIRGVQITDSFDDAPFGWVIARADGRREIRLTARIVPRRRGIINLGPVMSRFGFPFGLIEREMELLPVETHRVCPAPGTLRRALFRQWLSRAVPGEGEQHSQHRHISASEAEVHGLRIFRAGDSPRWIHWRTSARRGELMVREFENAAPPRLLLIVDIPAGSDHAVIESLLSLASTICVEWVRETGAKLCLVAGGTVGKTAEVVAPAGVLEALYLLAEMLPAGADSPILPLDELRTFWLQCPALVLCSGPNGTAREAMRSLTGRLLPQIDSVKDLQWYAPPEAAAPVSPV